MRGVLSVGFGVLCLLAVGCAKPPDAGILSAVRESVTGGVPAGQTAPEIRSLAVTRKKRMYWGRHVWTAEVQAIYGEVPSGSEETARGDDAAKAVPFRVVITRPEGSDWHYEVQNDRPLPGGA